MGIIKMIMSFFDGRALGEQTVEAIEVIFKRIQQKKHYENPHSWLASTWLTRMKSRGKNVKNPGMIKLALDETFPFACIEPPLCARALGLFLLQKQNPDIVEEYPEFMEEYNELMAPVWKAKEDGTIDELFEKYNQIDVKNLPAEPSDE